MPSSLLSRTKAVIFDFDGVLVDSEPISLGELGKTMAKHGIDLEWKDLVTHFLGTSPKNTTQFMIDRTGRDPSAIYPAEWEANVLEGLKKGLKMLAHAEALLDRLDAMAIPYCLASGSSLPRLQMSLDIIGQSHRFTDRMFSSDMVPNGKPAPDIFLYSAEKLNVDPSEAMVIEDGIAGTLGACAAGVGSVVGFIGGSHLSDDALRSNHAKALTEAGSHVVIGSLADLLD